MKIAARSARSGTGLVLGLSLLFGGFCPPVSAQGFRGGGGEAAFHLPRIPFGGWIAIKMDRSIRTSSASCGISTRESASTSRGQSASRNSFRPRKRCVNNSSRLDRAEIFRSFGVQRAAEGLLRPGVDHPPSAVDLPHLEADRRHSEVALGAASIDGPKNPLTAIDEVIVTGAKTETGIAAEIPRRISRPKNPQSRKFVSPRIFPATIASKTQMATGKLACTNGTAKLSRNSLTWTAMVMAC